MFLDLSWAEMIGSGTYYGYATTDRWGQNVFHLGPYHLFLSDKVTKQLKMYIGKPLELNVSKIENFKGDGAMIQEVDNVSVKEFVTGLVLFASVESDSIKKSEGLTLHLVLCNESKEEITICPRSLAVVLATKYPFQNAAIGYKDSDNRAYWYYQYFYCFLGENNKPLKIACREISLPWSNGELVEYGCNIRIADGYLGLNGWVTLKSKAKFEADIVVGKELLPGEYEVFFYMTTGNLSSVPGPMSERIRFDVINSNK
jgi:hypothetical protein